MVISKRERYIGIITGAVIGLFLFNWIIFGPLMDRMDDLDTQIKAKQADVQDADRNLALKGSAEQHWALLSHSMLTRDNYESKILNDVRDWAQEAGMTLSSLKPERVPEKEGEFYKVSFRATGSGQMMQIARFLHRIQTATIPVRITDLSLTSRKEGNDDLSVSVGLATIYLGEADKLHPSQNSTVSMAVQR